MSFSCSCQFYLQQNLSIGAVQNPDKLLNMLTRTWHFLVLKLEGKLPTEKNHATVTCLSINKEQQVYNIFCFTTVEEQFTA
jgi:hypothetical protein